MDGIVYCCDLSGMERSSTCTLFPRQPLWLSLPSFFAKTEAEQQHWVTRVNVSSDDMHRFTTVLHVYSKYCTV